MKLKLILLINVLFLHLCALEANIPQYLRDIIGKEANAEAKASRKWLKTGTSLQLGELVLIKRKLSENERIYTYALVIEILGEDNYVILYEMAESGPKTLISDLQHIATLTHRPTISGAKYLALKQPAQPVIYKLPAVDIH